MSAGLPRSFYIFPTLLKYEETGHLYSKFILQNKNNMREQRCVHQNTDTPSAVAEA